MGDVLDDVDDVVDVLEGDADAAAGLFEGAGVGQVQAAAGELAGGLPEDAAFAGGFRGYGLDLHLGF
jgi:hypothetical protein